jgi:hypothetical protein
VPSATCCGSPAGATYSWTDTGARKSAQMQRSVLPQLAMLSPGKVPSRSIASIASPGGPVG